MCGGEGREGEEEGIRTTGKMVTGDMTPAIMMGVKTQMCADIQTYRPTFAFGEGLGTRHTYTHMHMHTPPFTYHIPIHKRRTHIPIQQTHSPHILTFV